ncbi:tetrathionate reductase family octaheme c-type cytochrome [uncultured Roseovarius sp.]|uniref:tetrathionate reductase family octaheme c-type cytochrome n=1 Tax=uncultured Roseovarius sp. TaxID=293344 RepID=UPI0025E7CACE|nr:tetrathionate reductase family octaheme c-type cytochrome [uncultured Roseovarius sp.]
MIRAIVFIGLTSLASPVFAQDTAPGVPGSGSTADHSKFEVLQKEFSSGPEVTKACLSCHTEADDQVMHSIHFKWEFEHPETGQSLGKRNVINAFCGAVAGNEPRCTSCHAGYGWEDMQQSSAQAQATPDCLVCHDTSGQYTKTATGAGHPPLDPVPPNSKTITGAKSWPVDLGKAARSVGEPTRANCGNCHFYGGGGDNVKHGDLSSALYNPARAVDVHMSPEGEDFTCSTCHVSDQHDWAGSRYLMQASDPHGQGKPGAARNAATCESCHGNAPHEANLKGLKLNDHTDTLACQTCHIPEFARGGVATKTVWDWSTAGKLDEDGNAMAISDYLESDGDHRHTYMSTKGDFEWGEDVPPVYAWFNGVVEYTTGDRKIDPTQTVEINPIHGRPDAADSRIWPFKRMEGRQAYDSVMNELVYTHVWGPDTDTALWTNFDWAKAIKAGMEAASEDYSGEYDFVDTYMYWPITHMVAPAEDALDCATCHAKDGRMSGITGVNMPGTTPFNAAGLLGLAMVIAALAGVVIHALIRITRKGGSHG